LGVYNSNFKAEIDLIIAFVILMLEAMTVDDVRLTISALNYQTNAEEFRHKICIFET